MVVFYLILIENLESWNFGPLITLMKFTLHIGMLGIIVWYVKYCPGQGIVMTPSMCEAWGCWIWVWTVVY